MKYRILFLVPTDFDSLKKKGVEKMILERDEGGFFERVITVHPIANKSRIINLNDVHSVYEIGFDLIPFSHKFKILKYLQVPFHFIRIISLLLFLIKKENIHIIRATDPYWMGFLGYIISRIKKLPFCISIHADYDKLYNLNIKYSVKVLGSRRLALLMEKYVLSRCDMILFISRYLQNKFLQKGIIHPVSRIIYHGVDFSAFVKDIKFNIFNYSGINKCKKIICFIARISKDNYIDDVLLFARELSKKRNDFAIVIVGGGTDEDRIINKVAQDSNLKRFVFLTGFLPREVCYDIYCQSYIALCLMSGFSLIEACAAGLPVLAYDVEWHGELVQDGVNGFLVNEHDIEKLVIYAEYLLNNEKKAREMGEKSRLLALSRHDISITSEVKRSCYRELIEYKSKVR